MINRYQGEGVRRVGMEQTQRVTVQHPDGQTKTYFLKTCSDAIGPVMMKSEFISLSTIHSFLPALVP